MATATQRLAPSDTFLYLEIESPTLLFALVHYYFFLWKTLPEDRLLGLQVFSNT